MLARLDSPGTPGWFVASPRASPPLEIHLANHKSALKRARQSLRRNKRNTHIKSTMRTHVKNFRSAVEAGNTEEATTKLRIAESAIRRAASKGVIPARRASRSVSRLAKHLSTI